MKNRFLPRYSVFPLLLMVCAASLLSACSSSGSEENQAAVTPPVVLPEPQLPLTESHPVPTASGATEISPEILPSISDHSNPPDVGSDDGINSHSVSVEPAPMATPSAIPVVVVPPAPAAEIPRLPTPRVSPVIRRTPRPPSARVRPSPSPSPVREIPRQPEPESEFSVTPPSASSLTDAVGSRIYGFVDFSGNEVNPCWGSPGQRPSEAGRARLEDRNGPVCGDVSARLRCLRLQGTRSNDVSGGEIRVVQDSIANITIQTRYPNWRVNQNRLKSLCARLIEQGSGSLEESEGIADLDFLTTEFTQDHRPVSLVVTPRYQVSNWELRSLTSRQVDFFNACMNRVIPDQSLMHNASAEARWLRASAADYCGRIAESWIVPRCIRPLFGSGYHCGGECTQTWAQYLADRTQWGIETSASHSTGEQEWLKRLIHAPLTEVCSRRPPQLVQLQDLVQTDTSCPSELRDTVLRLIQHCPRSPSRY